jgi:hypothetical protein
MNEIDEMFTYLGDCDRTIKATRNTLKLADIQAADYDEILRECQNNIEWANKDLDKVRQFLYPEKYATMH